MKASFILTIFIIFTFVGCTSDQYEMSETDLFFAKKYNAESAHIGYKSYEKRIDGKLYEDSKFLFIKLENVDNVEKIFNDHKYAYYFGKEISTFFSDSFKITTEIPFQAEELRVIFVKKRRFLTLNFDKEKTLEYDWNKK